MIDLDKQPRNWGYSAAAYVLCTLSYNIKKENVSLEDLFFPPTVIKIQH